jgi:hypothetical protein
LKKGEKRPEKQRKRIFILSLIFLRKKYYSALPDPGIFEQRGRK